MHLAGGESISLHTSCPWGRHGRGSGRHAVLRHGELSRGATALLLWVGSREHATLLPKRINHRSDLRLILTISLSDACKTIIYLAPKGSTLLPGEGHLLFPSCWRSNFAVAARHYTHARRRMPCQMRVPEQGRLPPLWCRTCSYARCLHCRGAGTGQCTNASASRLFSSKSHWVA